MVLLQVYGGHLAGYARPPIRDYRQMFILNQMNLVCPVDRVSVSRSSARRVISRSRGVCYLRPGQFTESHI